MKKIVTMGEIMLRLSTPGHQRFVQAESFDVIYGGGEANVAVSLANYGLDPYFVSKLPDNPIGQSAINHLRKFGVNTDYVARGGERVGIYYLETGASMRASTVVYDRAHSSISEAVLEDFDFDAIFKDAEWFHFTGITPALGENGAKITEAALKAAKRHNVTVSVDLNYRKKLWTPEQAQKVMTGLMQYVDVCIGNEEDAEKVLGFKPGDSDVTKGELEIDAYKDIFKRMKETFGFKYVVTTLRESHSASDNGWSALIYNGEEFYQSKKYEIRIVDRVGGGDSFAGGLIYGLATSDDFKHALEFAVGASALKHTIFGDANLVTVAEVEALIQGDASGRVQR
ncbi:sugar kinase [Anaerotalea alkaliphila]|uniref:Sugar kinase n=1 Tax=Anaerotalea alkaliphila TaxID=2662126 RepID=A0A7X5HT76_9FIRM|nr:sugar kinase [Anaerotalea alkaliphila]NDL66208.1 sugar kinase [Anaerotalea alkaliphila]